MNSSNKKLGAFAGAMALALSVGVIASQSAGCEEAAKQCGLECPDKGVVEGNASITGYIAIDSFFKSVVNFRSVATGVANDIRAELRGIQSSFGITDAELKAAGNIGAAVKAKIQGKAELRINAQPARCEVDAKFSAQATVDCQAEANCEATPPKVAVQCMGQCTVEASASGTCDAMAEARCVVSGPQVSCTGECSGTCSVTGMAAATCEGTCNGTCTGGCEGTQQGGQCNGKCTGTCQGSCELSGELAANCTGSCNGTCNYKKPEAGCEASARVECEFQAMASAQCEGRCDGDFEPPKVDCEASASCEASAKAEAKFQATCTPPSVDIDVVFQGSAEGRAQLEFAIADLRLRLPRLLAAVKRGGLVVEAGTELASDGAAAIKGTLGAIGDGKVDAVAAYRIGSCAPSELTASATAITEGGKDLTAQITAAGQLTTQLGM